ncbi:MAG: 16S rRNA (guanine(527)-N(7))-methyltransferase RsmG [Candidatus Angelobacter sp. Gp1-AA117]|nr:MAG: 16S rRNA (guanine(527)-N(7))-methyltransferase RsmG [Candidatus Angelobacter sp. Gp1-AA117]
MGTAEIAALLAPYIELDEKRLAGISIYINVLLKWNARMNLTAVRDPRQIVQRHFGESFFAARKMLGPEDALTIVDLGSGAGFPGLPIAMCVPRSEVTLIESQSKKAAFLNEVIRSLDLKNAQVFSQRAESYTGTAELVTMRAVERFEAVLPTAAKLVKPGGRLALMIGAAQVESAVTLLPELVRQEAIPVPGGHSRVLLVGTKIVKVE